MNAFISGFSNAGNGIVRTEQAHFGRYPAPTAQKASKLRGAAATTSSVSGGTPAGTNSTEGASATNANYQPYITVYMWKRTA